MTSYGILINRKNLNLGDDIQSYAESLFLPRIDYLVDREYINKFKPRSENEKVAVIMGAWWSFRKWNFPPADSIIPLCTSMHITDYTVADGGTPIQDEFIKGLGGEYLRHFGPVGSRDIATLELLKKNNIPAYFSGCVTLTLPKQKMTEDNGKYILLVDVSQKVRDKVIESLGNTDLEVRSISNIRQSRRTEDEMDSWDHRRAEAIELLTQFQNAKYVVTSRLHAALPCLSMEVPVLCVFDKNNSRFSPYNELLHMADPDDFLSGDYDYDLINPPQNKKAYLKYRKSLTKQMKEFVRNVASDSNPIDTEVKYSVDVDEWRSQLMEETLDKWVYDSQIIAGNLTRLKEKYRTLESELLTEKKKNRDLLVLSENNQKRYDDLVQTPHYRMYKRVGKTLRSVGIIK